SDQHAADSRHVVARVECVPAPAKIGLEPAGEIHWAIGRWHADVPEIAGAIARRNVHAAAERDGEMRVVATHTLAFIEDLPGRHGPTSAFGRQERRCGCTNCRRRRGRGRWARKGWWSGNRAR